eukprot:PhM_4_TR10495/c0_g1_i1/m.8977
MNTQSPRRSPLRPTPTTASSAMDLSASSTMTPTTAANNNNTNRIAITQQHQQQQQHHSVHTTSSSAVQQHTSLTSIEYRRDMDILTASRRDNEASQRAVFDLRQQVAELAPYKEQAFQLRSNLVIVEEKMRFREDEIKRLQASLQSNKAQFASEVEMAQQRASAFEERLSVVQGQLNRMTEERDKHENAAHRASVEAQSNQRQFAVEKQQLHESLSHLQNALQNKEHENADLHQRLGDVSTELQRHEVRVMGLSKELAESRNTVNRVGEEVAQLRSQKDKLQRELSEVLRQKEHAEQQTGLMRNEVDRIPQLLEQIDMEKQQRNQELARTEHALREANQLNNALERANEEIPQLRRRVDETRAQFDEAQAMLVTAQRQLEDTALALREAVTSKEEAMAEVCSMCDDALRPLASLSRAPPVSPSAMRSYRSALMRTRSAIMDASSEISTLREELAVLQQAEVQRKALVSEKETLTRRLDEERYAHQTTESQLQSTMSAYQSLEHDLARMQTDLAARTAEVLNFFPQEFLNTANHSAADMSQVSAASGAVITTSFSVARRDNASALFERIDQLGSRVRALVHVRESQDRKIRSLEGAVEDATRLHDDAKHEVAVIYTQMKERQVATEEQNQRELSLQRERLSTEYEAQLTSVTSTLRDAENENAKQRSVIYELRAATDEMRIELQTERERVANKAVALENANRKIDALETEIAERVHQHDVDTRRTSDQIERIRAELSGMTRQRDEALERCGETAKKLEDTRVELMAINERLIDTQHKADRQATWGDAMWQTFCSVIVALRDLDRSYRYLRFSYRTLIRMYSYLDASHRHLTSVCGESLSDSSKLMSPRRGKTAGGQKKRRSLRSVAIAVVAARRLRRVHGDVVRDADRHRAPSRDCVLQLQHGTAGDVAHDTLRMFFGADATFQFDLMNTVSRACRATRTDTESMAAVITEVVSMKHQLQRCEALVRDKEIMLKKCEEQLTDAVPRDVHLGVVAELKEAQQQLETARSSRTHDLSELTRTQQEVLRRVHESEELQRHLRESMMNLSTGTSASSTSEKLEWRTRADTTQTHHQHQVPNIVFTAPTPKQDSSNNNNLDVHRPPNIGINMSRPTSPLPALVSPLRSGGRGPTSPSFFSGLIGNGIDTDEILGYINQLDSRVTHALTHPR